jgi:hypothetical protein
MFPISEKTLYGTGPKKERLDNEPSNYPRSISNRGLGGHALKDCRERIGPRAESSRVNDSSNVRFASGSLHGLIAAGHLALNTAGLSARSQALFVASTIPGQEAKVRS